MPLHCTNEKSIYGLTTKHLQMQSRALKNPNYNFTCSLAIYIVDSLTSILLGEAFKFLNCFGIFTSGISLNSSTDADLTAIAPAPAFSLSLRSMILDTRFSSTKSTDNTLKGICVIGSKFSSIRKFSPAAMSSKNSNFSSEHFATIAPEIPPMLRTIAYTFGVHSALYQYK